MVFSAGSNSDVPHRRVWLLLFFHLFGLIDWLLFVGCFTSQQHDTVSQGQICSDGCTCCHTEIEVADQTCYLTQLQHTDTGQTSPSTDPVSPSTWQGTPIFKSLVWLDPEKSSQGKEDWNPGQLGWRIGTQVSWAGGLEPRSAGLEDWNPGQLGWRIGTQVSWTGGLEPRSAGGITGTQVCWAGGMDGTQFS